MPEYNFKFDWNKISTLGKVRILVEQVVTQGGGGGGSGTDDRVNLINGSATYPLMSVTKATVSGVSGVIWKYDDGSQDGLNVFVADGTGLNTVKAAIEAQIPTGVVYVADFDESPQGYVFVDIGTDGYYMPNKDNFDQLSALVAQKVNTSAVKSIITASDTNPVNSVAVIAYINSLDATNTSY